tara:strand:+ start:205 stop:465 length:261 start_codon:yes stop_codon:yes gene_type:complete
MTASLDSAGKVTVVNEVHEAKAASPMLVGRSGSECYYSLASLVTYYTYKLTELCLLTFSPGHGSGESDLDEGCAACAMLSIASIGA